jgi:hypothetical protein
MPPPVCVHDLLQLFVPIKEQEVQPVLYSFSALFTVSLVNSSSSSSSRHAASPRPACVVGDACVVLCAVRLSLQILTSYFLLLPLREDAGISLGEWTALTH